MAVRERAYFDEPVPAFDRRWNRLPFVCAQSLRERAFLGWLDETRRGRAIAVALTLAKQGGASSGS